MLTIATLYLLVILVLTIFHYPQNKGVVYLNFTIFITGVRHLQLYIYSQPNLKELWMLWMPILNIHILPFAVLAPVSMYFYFRSIEIGKLYWQQSSLLHFVPSLFLIINYIPYYLTPFEQKSAFYAQLLMDSSGMQTMNLNLFIQDKYLRLFPLAMDIFYFTLFLVKYAASTKNDRKKEKKFIRHALAIYMINWIPSVYLIFNSAFLNIGNTNFDHSFKNTFIPNISILSILASIIPLTFLLLPSFTYQFQIEFLKTTLFYKFFKKSPKVQEQKHYPDDLTKILDYFKNEKPYLNENFTLNDLSNRLAMPQSHISYLINNHLNTSFPKFKNQCRVHHAIELLNKNQHENFSIEGVASLAGFKNKSTFYIAFKEELNTTPLEWLRIKTLKTE